MTSELVPWRGTQVPLLNRDSVSRATLNDWAAWVQASQLYMGPPAPVTTYGSKPAEPISMSFEGFVYGMLYADGPVAAVEAYRLRVFGQAPLLYQKLVDGRAGDMFDDPALDRLRTPWTGATLSDLMKRALVYGDFAGNAFIVDMDDELVLVRPDWVEIILAKRMHRGAQVGWRQVGIMYYEGGLGVGEGVPFLPGEYSHFVPGLPDPLATYRGMSWLTPLIREVKADKSAGDHKVAFFENAASPNLAVSLPKEVSPKQFEEFVAKMDTEHSGVANAYKTLYTGGGADVTVIGANMQQMDFSAVVGKGETRIANAGGVPPTLLSFSEGMQGSSLNAGNYTAAKRNFVDTTMRDLWQNFAGSTQAMDAFAPPPESRLWYDARDIPFLHEDAKDLAEIQQVRSSTINAYVSTGWTPESSVQSVAQDDVTLLVHSGLTSVQLLPPGESGEPSDPIDPDQPDDSDSGGDVKDETARALIELAREVVQRSGVGEDEIERRIRRAMDEAQRAFNPDLHPRAGVGPNGGQFISTLSSARELLTQAEIDRDYGDELDTVEFTEGSFVAAHSEGGLTVQVRTGDLFDVQASPGPVEARDWADRVESMLDEPGGSASPNGLVDWDVEDGVLIGRHESGDIAVRWVGEDDGDSDDLDDYEGFDLSPEEAQAFAGGLRDMAEIADDPEPEDSGADDQADLEDDEVGRSNAFELAHPRGAKGRFRDVFSSLTDWARGLGDGNPLDGFERPTLLKAAKELGLTPKRGLPDADLKQLIYGEVRDRVRAARAREADKGRGKEAPPKVIPNPAVVGASAKGTFPQVPEAPKSKRSPVAKAALSLHGADTAAVRRVFSIPEPKTIEVDAILDDIDLMVSAGEHPADIKIAIAKAQARFRPQDVTAADLIPDTLDTRPPTANELMWAAEDDEFVLEEMEKAFDLIANAIAGSPESGESAPAVAKARAVKAAPKPAQPSASEIAAKLKSADSAEEGLTDLDGLTLPQLKQVATAMDVSSAGSKDRVRERIRDRATAHHIGHSLDAERPRSDEENKAAVLAKVRREGVPRPQGKLSDADVQALLGAADHNGTLDAPPSPAVAKAPDVDRQERAKAMVRDYVKGSSLSEVAEKHGVSSSTVHKILTESGLQLRGRGAPRAGSAAPKARAVQGPNVKTKAGRNAFLADLIDEELAADNPALDDRVVGTAASPREILQGMRDRLRNGEDEDFENGYSMVHGSMAVRYGSPNSPVGPDILSAFQRINEKYRAVAPVGKPKAMSRRSRASNSPLSSDTPPPKPQTIQPRPQVELRPEAQRVFDIIDSFDDPPSREEAHELLRELTTADLRAIGKNRSIPGAAKLSVQRLRDEIVQATAGARRDSRAIRGFDGISPNQPNTPRGDARPKAGSPDRAKKLDLDRLVAGAAIDLEEGAAKGASPKALNHRIRAALKRVRIERVGDGYVWHRPGGDVPLDGQSFADRAGAASQGARVAHLPPVQVHVDASSGSETGRWRATEVTGLTGSPQGLLAATTDRVRFSGQHANDRLRFPNGRPPDEWEARLRAGYPDAMREQLEAKDADRRAKDAATGDRHIRALDRAMEQSPLPSDVVLWRGMRPSTVGIPDGDATGFEWTDPGFVGTSANRSVAAGSFGERGAVLRILAPRGTRAIGIQGGGEAEVLLNRGTRFRVVADTRSPSGGRQLDIEIVLVDGQSDDPEIRAAQDLARLAEDVERLTAAGAGQDELIAAARTRTSARGLQPLARAGEVIPFDPATHDTPERPRPKAGTSVLVIRPGYTADGVVLEKPLVMVDTTSRRVRPSGLPADRKPESGDFEDLAVRVSQLGGLTEQQRYEIFQDLNASELARLARKFPGRGAAPGQSREQGLRLPDDLTTEEKRRWLAKRLSTQRWHWR